MRFYLNSNTNQIYSALTNNAVTSFATTTEKLRSRTFSFMSENYIFLTKGLVPEELRRWKTDDVFFPVTLEMDFSAADKIPAYLVVMEESGAVLQDEMTNLKDAPDNTIGAFICGEIPAAYLSGIFFENEENQVRFRKPSTDLWFPEELYKIIGEEIPAAEPSLTAELVAEWSGAVDARLTDEEKEKVAAIVNQRNRYKAIAYFALRETANWQMDDLKSNVDLYIVDLLDKHAGTDGALYKALAAHLEACRATDERVPTIDGIIEKDTILLPADKDNIDTRLLPRVLRWFYTFDKEQNTVDRECIDTIRELVLAEKKEPEAEALFDVIKEFLTSTYMNPEKALAKLKGHPVFKALMKFLDSSDNDAFMNRGCEDLTQYERRYAYMMFAALKGMTFVEREWKSNVNLEHRLEELALNRFPDGKMISSVPASDELVFCVSGEHLYGIQLTCSYWMGKQSTLEVLAKPENEDKLMALYTLLSKDKSLKISKLDCFETPCVVTVAAGEFHKELKANNMDELKKILKDTKLANEIGKKVKTKVDLAAFLKKYVLNDVWYSTAFEKHCIDIQQLCRS